MIQSNFHVTVHYTKPLQDMINALKYDSVSANINDDHFPVTRHGVVEIELGLVAPNGRVTTVDAIEEMKRIGARPAGLWELLAFGAQHRGFPTPDHPIVALDARWLDLQGRPLVPLLSRSFGEQRLELQDANQDWQQGPTLYWRFLAAYSASEVSVPAPAPTELAMANADSINDAGDSCELCGRPMPSGQKGFIYPYDELASIEDGEGSLRKVWERGPPFGPISLEVVFPAMKPMASDLGGRRYTGEWTVCRTCHRRLRYFLGESASFPNDPESKRILREIAKAGLPYGEEYFRAPETKRLFQEITGREKEQGWRPGDPIPGWDGDWGGIIGLFIFLALFGGIPAIMMWSKEPVGATVWGLGTLVLMIVGFWWIRIGRHRT